MPTPIPADKPVWRETETLIDDKGIQRKLLVGLGPGDNVSFRLKGTQRPPVSVDARTMFGLAQTHADSKASSQAELKKAEAVEEIA